MSQYLLFWFTFNRTRSQSGPDASAQSIEHVARLSRNVRQPDHVLGDPIAGLQVERRPGASEEWLAAAKHDRMEVEVDIINKTEVGQASCQGPGPATSISPAS